MSWLGRFRMRRSAERDLAEEMHQHLEEKIQELVGRGVAQKEASAQARREFGNVALLQEQSRDVWRSALSGDLLSDVRYACRFLRRSKMFAAASIVTIAVAVGANAAVFSIVNAILLRPLPIPESDRLVSVQSRDIRGTPHPTSLSYPTFFDFRRANRVFENIVCYRDAAFTLTDSSPAIQVPGEIVSWDFFSALRVAPTLGRGFLPIEEQPGTHVVVLSHELWSTYFGADENLVGRAISIDREPYVVVGVAPRGFRFPLVRRPKLWVTLARDAVAGSGQPVTQQRGARMLDSTARLKPDVSIAAAQAEMDLVAGAIAAEHQDQNRNITTTYVRPELERIAGPTRIPLMILLVAVGLVLLIACANIANLLLARVMDRARELAMRLAIGASRMRLIRQVLTENLVIALAGSAVGVVLAAAAIRSAAPLWPDGVPRVEEITVDWRVVAFCVGLSLFTAVVIALPTVLRVARADVSHSLKTGSWGNTGGHDTLRSSLLIAQVALGLMLLSSATLLIDVFLHLVRRDLGFRPDHLLTFSISLSGSAYDEARQEIFLQQLLERIRSAPGVAAAAAGSPLPLTGHEMRMSFGIQDRPVAPSDRPYADMAIVTPGFFRTIGARLEDGRDFAESDDEHAPPVLIVNRAFADRFFPGERAIGKRIEPGATLKNQGPLMREIVGIVGDARQSPSGFDREPIYYFPYRQLPWFPPSIVVRTVLAPETLRPTLRGLVAELDRQVPTADMRTMDDRLAGGVAVPRFLTLLLSMFAAVALILTAIGLYGATAYTVSKQTREIGVRIALGATRRSVTTGVMNRAARFVGIGVLLGLAGSVAAGRLLGSLMPGVSVHNARVLGLACTILVLTAATAAFLPARRAASIDPLIALRAE
jgi:putative ABC transport system permease protein